MNTPNISTTPAEHPLFEIVTTTAGAISIKNKVVNEIMHNPVGPWLEANALYIEQSNLKEKLRRKDGATNDEFVIFDVGLGAAANSLAALACWRSLGKESRPLRIVSFECDLTLLRFALDHASVFAHFHGFEVMLETLLRDGYYEEEGLCWNLRHGDFVQLIDAEPYHAHLVFYDPYSPKKNEDMWTTSCFTKLRAKSRDKADGGTELYTYSQATRIRVSLICAGFFLGQGLSTGLKENTTEASTDFAALRAPFLHSWLDRFRRSHIRYPFDCTKEQEAGVDQKVESYFQTLLQ